MSDEPQTFNGYLDECAAEAYNQPLGTTLGAGCCEYCGRPMGRGEGKCRAPYSAECIADREEQYQSSERAYAKLCAEQGWTAENDWGRIK